MWNRLWSTRPLALDLGLLILRLSSGLLLARYGLQKFNHYAEWSKDFPDPLGVGSPVSLALTIFGELFCSLLVVAGLFTRYALVILIVMMCIIFFVIHGKDTFDVREHSLSFLFPFLLIFLAGPGQYSLDRMLKR